MNKLLFKTNINCSGCEAAIAPALNEVAGIKHWKVNTTNPDKVLAVETDALSSREIIAIVNKAGFKAEALPK